jgi:hypothetical protein
MGFKLLTKVNNSTAHPLQYVDRDGTVFGQFFNPNGDRKYHFAESVPYHGPPSRVLCEIPVYNSRMSASRREEKTRDVCTQCLLILLDKATQ